MSFYIFCFMKEELKEHLELLDRSHLQITTEEQLGPPSLSCCCSFSTEVEGAKSHLFEKSDDGFCVEIKKNTIK